MKLLDFGVAKVRGNLTHTKTGVRIGTPLYMSPEQVKDSKHLDYKTDIYSLAVTFYHLLSGVAPYDYNTTSEFEIQLKICQEPLDLSRLPQAWQALLRPLLEKDPELRGELCLPYETRKDDSGSRHMETRYPNNSRSTEQATRVIQSDKTKVSAEAQAKPHSKPQTPPQAKPKSGLSDTAKVFIGLAVLILGYVLLVQLFFSGSSYSYDDYNYDYSADTTSYSDYDDHGANEYAADSAVYWGAD